MKRVLLIVALLLLVVGCTKTKEDINKKKFEMIATEYYEKELKGKVIGMTEYTITIKGLKAKGYDVSSLVNSETGKECDESSSIIIAEKDNSYETKINLICD